MNAQSIYEEDRKTGIPLRVLIVEDSEIDFLFLVQELRRGGYDPVCERVETSEAMSAALDRKAWDAILIDYTLPHFNGIAALELINRKQIDLPAIIVSGTIDDETAVAAMKTGAHDYIMKNNLPRLIPAIEREMRETKERQERRRIEKALQETEKKFFTVFQHSPVPMAIASIEEGRLFDVNEQYTRLMGFSQAELIGRTTTELNLWADPEERKRYVQSIQWNHGKIHSYPVSVRTKSGNIINVFFSADIIKINNAPYLLSSAVDITDRLHAEKKLRESEELYRSLTTTADSMYLVDRDCRYLFLNDEYVKRLGRPKDQIIGRNYGEFHTEEETRTFADHVTRIFETGASSQDDHRSARDGRHFVRTLSPVMNPDGTTTAITIVSKDTTERKRAEEALQLSRIQLRAFAGRLQAVREEEGRRIAREIHDELGGALTSLKIDCSLLMRTAAKVRDTALRDSLYDGMGSMTNLIDTTMRTVRRIATELRPSILDDLGLVAALEWQLDDFQKRTGIPYEFLSSHEYIDLDGKDATALFRIFQETITNVARHSGASRVRVNLHATDDAFRLVVDDNGKGIREEEISNTKSLGLLGIRERAMIFGGHVTVTGHQDRGTTVTVEGHSLGKRNGRRNQEGVDE